jgi:hypothetical protein
MAEALEAHFHLLPFILHAFELFLGKKLSPDIA